MVCHEEGWKKCVGENGARASRGSRSDHKEHHTSAHWGARFRRIGGLGASQTSLKLLLLLLELLKLGFSDRLVGTETAPAFSETHAESSFTPGSPTLPLLFAARVPTDRSHREFVAWCLFPTKVGSREGRDGDPGVGVFGGAFLVVLPFEFAFSLDLVLMFNGRGFDVVLLVVVP